MMEIVCVRAYVCLSSAAFECTLLSTRSGSPCGVKWATPPYDTVSKAKSKKETRLLNDILVLVTGDAGVHDDWLVLRSLDR